LYEMYKTRTEYTYTNITSSYLNPRWSVLLATVKILHRQARDWVRCLRNTLIWQLEFLCLHLPFDFMLALNRNRYHLQSPL
jgi:ABC-type polysaccharide transport system permease subunit